MLKLFRTIMLGALATLVLAACTPPAFQMPDRPAVKLLEVRPPVAPVPQPLPLPDLVGQFSVTDEGSAPITLPAEPRIAIMPVETDLPAIVQIIEDQLELRFLRGGYSRLLGPRQLRSVTVQKVVVRDGTVTWQAPLDQLMKVEPVAPVDLLVGVRVLSVGDRKIPVDQNFALNPTALESYRKNHDAFAVAAQAALRQWTAQREAFSKAFERARAVYEDDGGIYLVFDGYEEVGEPTSGDEAVRKRDEFIGQIDALISNTQSELKSLRQADQLQTDASARTVSVNRELVEVTARVRMVHGTDMRVLWLATLSVTDSTFEGAYARLLDRIVEHVAQIQGGSAAVP